MKQKFLIRYLILIGILLVCAGGVWYWSEHSKTPSANAVLARAEEMLVNAVPVQAEGTAADVEAFSLFCRAWRSTEAA